MFGIKFLLTCDIFATILIKAYQYLNKIWDVFATVLCDEP